MGSLSVVESPWISTKLPPSPLTPFQQRQANRSPVDSPPIAKKHLRVEGPDGADMGGQTRRRRDQSSPRTREVHEAEKENRSILKRRSGGSSPNTDLVARSPPRHVDFQNSVLVFHFDRLEGDHVCSESQRLSVDAKDRKEFLLRTMLENRQRSLASSEPSTSSLHSKPTFRIPYIDETPDSTAPSRAEPSSSRSTSTTSRTGQSESRPLPSLPSTSETPATPDFSFYEDNERHLKIKFMVPLGPGVAANDVLVKANMTGNKVRVLATRTLSTPGPRGRLTTVRQEFSERYQLPMEVDPYMITARMDSTGNLFVEAPVLTPDRKKELERERLQKADAGFTL